MTYTPVCRERLGITDEGELLDLMERNVPKQRLTPMAGFFAKEMLRRAKDASDGGGE